LRAVDDARLSLVVLAGSVLGLGILLTNKLGFSAPAAPAPRFPDGFPNAPG